MCVCVCLQEKHLASQEVADLTRRADSEAERARTLAAENKKLKAELAKLQKEKEEAKKNCVVC